MWGMAKEKEEAQRPRTGEERFAAYLEEIAAVLGHASRATPQPGEPPWICRRPFCLRGWSDDEEDIEPVFA